MGKIHTSTFARMHLTLTELKLEYKENPQGQFTYLGAKRQHSIKTQTVVPQIAVQIFFLYGHTHTYL
jgi:hypothetical protein